MRSTKNNAMIESARDKVASLDLDGLKAAGFLPLHDLFFPAIYYPPLTMYSPMAEEQVLAGYVHNPAYPASLYVHIPFCPTKCTFCHWTTSTNDSKEDIDKYLGYLEKEMALWKLKLNAGSIAPTSILVGGGTPTLPSPQQMSRYLTAIRKNFDLNRCVQFTVEAEPRTLLGQEGQEKLRVLKSCGVDRISLGVQSFDDAMLKAMNRDHSAKEAIAAIQGIKTAGFKSLSIDLIYGYPSQSVDSWIDTLETAHQLPIDAYQLYRLRIVPHGDKKGAIKHKYEKSPAPFGKLEDIYMMKAVGRAIAAKNGFNESFRRIFSRTPQDRSEYLMDYCCNLNNVVGVGISSWSNLQGRLVLNTSDGYKAYYDLIDKGKLPGNRGKLRSEDDERRRALVLPLKNTCVIKENYKISTGMSVEEAFNGRLSKIKQYGFLEETPERLALSEKGKFFADETVMQFYHPSYLPFPKSEYAEGVLNPHNA